MFSIKVVNIRWLSVPPEYHNFINWYVSLNLIASFLRRVTQVSFGSIEKSKDFPNGIKTDIKYRGFKNRIGEELSKFLVNCYIIKRIKKSKPNGEVFTYLTPVNTILDSINNKSNYLEEIDTIFNHPHFKDCKNIDEIKGKIEGVENLNNRKKIIKK